MSNDRSGTGASPDGSRAPLVHYWDTGEPPAHVRELLAAFRECNPEMEQLVFDQSAAAGFISERLGEREAKVFTACAVPSMQSDLFRYCAAYAMGGFYADVGFRCLTRLGPLLEEATRGMLFERNPPGYVLNGLLAFAEPGHPLPRLVLDVATINIERRISELVQMVTGPWILNGLVLLHRLGSAEGLRGDGNLDGIEALEHPFREHARALIPTAAAREKLPLMIDPLFEAVGSYDRIAEAFKGVRIVSLDAVADRLEELQHPLPYKRADSYWVNWQRKGMSIYR